MNSTAVNQTVQKTLRISRCDKVNNRALIRLLLLLKTTFDKFLQKISQLLVTEIASCVLSTLKPGLNNELTLLNFSIVSLLRFFQRRETRNVEYA